MVDFPSESGWDQKLNLPEMTQGSYSISYKKSCNNNNK